MIDKRTKYASKRYGNTGWSECPHLHFMVYSNLTYTVIVSFFYFPELPRPFANAIVPATAFVLSTLAVPFFKKWWVNK
ncbi:MAG: hypothetical protein Q7S66_02435 [bacterium]|nr:hypothetical protein [bacterium]